MKDTLKLALQEGSVTSQGQGRTEKEDTYQYNQKLHRKSGQETLCEEKNDEIGHI